MKLFAIIEDTFREAFARKTIIGFFSISSFFLLIALIAAIFITPGPIAMTGNGGQNAQVDLPTVPGVVQMIQLTLTGFLHFAAIFLSIFATASIIPNTMEKGSIDLLLSKPVSRDAILHGKFLGSISMVFLNVTYYVIGMWLIISIKTSVWNFGFLATIFPITFSFLVLFAAMMVLGIATRSSALTIILLYAFIYLVSPILQNRELIFFRFIENETIQSVITGIYYILPKPGDMSDLAGKLVMHQDITWMPVWSSALFAIVMYGIAVLLFRRKDF